jgi:hypothetical protein
MEKGLKSSTVALMIAAALFFDVLQALLTPIVVGYFVPVISYPTFWLWFRLNGIDFISSKRAKTLGFGALIELIPGLDILPAFTLTVARIALDAKIKQTLTHTSAPSHTQTAQSTEESLDKAV